MTYPKYSRDICHIVADKAHVKRAKVEISYGKQSYAMMPMIIGVLTRHWNMCYVTKMEITTMSTFRTQSIPFVLYSFKLTVYKYISYFIQCI